MTYTEAYAHIDNLLDKAGTAYFTDTEKNQFLDLAVLEYTKGLINTLESDAQSMEKIAPLVNKSDSLAQSSRVITLPTNIPVYHILRAYTANNGYPINIMGYGEYASAKDNPFHKADTKNPVGLLRGLVMEVIGNTENVYLEYIKLPEVTHTGSHNLGGYGKNSGEEIVNIAVRKMMLSLEDPRYQLQINETSAEKR
jgi:hypothetical protein